MARPLRIEYKGAWYHVMNRGLEKRRIFFNDGERTIFLALLEEISRIFSIEIHAFSLMDNHYHLLIHTPLAGLGRAMRHLNGVYTQKFNILHKRDGPLFRGRYKAKLIDENNYLLELLRYIHRNPVDAGICGRPGDHRWTSHRYYLEKSKGFDWLKTGRLLELFGGTGGSAKDRLESFVNKSLPDDIHLEIKKVSLNIIGSDGFKEWVRRNFIEMEHWNSKSIPKKEKWAPVRPSPTTIIKTVAFMNDLTPCELRKKGYDNPTKLEAVYFLRELLGLPLKTIAGFARMRNENAVSQALYRVRRQMKSEKGYRTQMREKYRLIQSAQK